MDEINVSNEYKASHQKPEKVKKEKPVKVKTRKKKGFLF